VDQIAVGTGDETRLDGAHRAVAGQPDQLVGGVHLRVTVGDGREAWAVQADPPGDSATVEDEDSVRGQRGRHYSIL
jgi:hypothetical protein